MISVDEALNHINSAKVHLTPEIVPLSKSTNKILAEDIISPINMPPFRQSAMDGYALIINNHEHYQLVAESKAGDALTQAIKEGECMRIFTGAMVPKGANTVVAQENTKKEGSRIRLSKIPKQGANIRPIGEQVEKGDLVMKKGQKLNPASIGFLAGLGFTEVSVYKIPKVSIVVTGNELQKPGSKLQKGKIYESNAIMLEMALKNIGITNIEIFRTKDDIAQTKNTLQEALEKADVLLISGGISVGDYDFVKEALLDNQVEEIFYKVWQKPGKPLWFGKKRNKYIFALPGNPASAMTSFYIYVTPLLNKISGHKISHLKRVEAKTTTGFKNKNGKGLFLKARLNPDKTVDILDGQQSSMLHTYATSNVLAYIPPHKSEIQKDDIIECIKLPYEN